MISNRTILAMMTMVALVFELESSVRAADGSTSKVAPSAFQSIPGKLPLYFEPYDEGFVARGLGYSVSLQAAEARISLAEATLHLRPIDGTPTRIGEGLEPLPGKSNYFLGNDPTKWRRDVPHFSRVRYERIYPGVDLVFHTDSERLEFDFVLLPGSDPRIIRISVEGVEGLVEEGGDLLLKLPNEELRLRKPRLYQELDGLRKDITGEFRIEPNSRFVVGFQVGPYDQNRVLIIDPELTYSSYLGGTGGENTDSVALDAQGNIYVAGTTSSTNFPTRNPLQASKSGSFDAFVTKFNSTGSALVYSTYLGGIGAFDEVYAIAVDAVGNAYLAGDTTSSNFPTVNPIQAIYGGSTDSFIAKIGPDGAALLYSTYLGGSLADQGTDIAIDPDGNAYVTGRTVSTNFPVHNAIQVNHLGGFDDAFVTKITASGSALAFSTYLGGDGSDEARGIALDENNNIYVTGDTRSAGFPVLNALQPIKNLNADIFVTKIATDGSSLLYSTFLGGSGADESFGLNLIALDSMGNICVTGRSYSSDFPLVNPIQSTPTAEGDAIVAKIKADGSALVYSTYLGGHAYDDALAITVDAWGNAHVSGRTLSDGFPTKDPIQATRGGSGDIFLVEIDPKGSLIYSTYLGGTLEDRGNDIVLDPSGDPYVTGQVWSPNFPTVNPFQPNLRGSQDGFVVKVDVQQPPEEVGGLLWSDGSKATLEWTEALGAESYNVYRGDMLDLPKLLDAEVDSCLRISTANLDSGPVLTEEPSEGTFHWYLVRAENTVGLSLPGSATTGIRIHDPSGDCP